MLQGSRRKIKPLSTVLDSFDANPINFKEQLVEIFFHCHPPYMKEICEFTSEKLSKLAIEHIDVCILPKYVEMASLQCAEWLLSKTPQETESEVNPQVEADLFLRTVIADTERALTMEIKDYVYHFSCSQSKVPVGIMLGDHTTSKVAALATDITAQWTTKKCLKWAKSNSHVKLETEVIKAFHKKRTCQLGKLEPTSFSGMTCERVDICQLKSVLKNILSKPTIEAEDYQNALVAVLSAMKVFKCLTSILLHRQSIILDYLDLSLELTVHFVSNGGFKLDYGRNDSLKSGCSLLDNLIEVWILCKGYKVEIPIDKMLSVTAFKKYIKNEAVNKDCEVWRSLASVLILMISNAIVSSSYIEGLWMCRWYQLKNKDPPEFQSYIQAVSAFLWHWNSFSVYAQDLPIHFVRLASSFDKYG